MISFGCSAWLWACAAKNTSACASESLSACRRAFACCRTQVSVCWRGLCVSASRFGYAELLHQVHSVIHVTRLVLLWLLCVCMCTCLPLDDDLASVVYNLVTLLVCMIVHSVVKQFDYH